MPEIFGAPAGIMAVDQDQRDQAVTMMNLASGAQKLELGQMELQKQRSIMQQLSQRQQSGPSTDGRSSMAGATTPDLAHDMFDVAGIALNAGDLEYADKLATTGNKLMEGQSKIQKQSFDTNIKRLTTMSNLMDGVYDQATWNRANAEYTAMTGEPSPYAKYQYNPDLVGKIKTGVTSAKDKAYIANQDSEVALHRVMAAKDAHEIRKIDVETKKISDQDSLLLKSGGKPPTNVELEPVTDLISSNYGKAVTKEQARTLARPIYDRAKEIASNEGIDRDSAINRAFEEAKISGGLKNLTPQAKPLDQASELMNRILQRLNTDKGKVSLGLTGAGGFVRRVKEDVQNHLPYSAGGSDDTSANDFETDIEALKAIMPKAVLDMKGSSNKDARAAIATMTRGLRPGASNQNTASSINEIYRFLNNKDSDYFEGKSFTNKSQPPASKAKQDDSGFVEGQVYQNAKGQKGRYLGNGKWEEL